MDIQSLSNLLLNRTLMNIGQNDQANTSTLPSSSFSALLTEALLKAGLSKMENNQQTSPTNLYDVLNTFASSLGTSFGTGAATLEGDLLSSVTTGTPPVNTSSLQYKELAATDLNSHLKGVLQGTGDFFVEAGKKYQINPGLLAAISIHETGNGTSNAARYKYNVAGMMGKNGLKTYDSVKDSIFDMARNLRNNYLDKGKTTISQIGAKYAPIGAANDPTQLNNHWVNGVQQYFSTITNQADFA